ncbi:4a-hydroxytetrahydrobiopterin dehydratase [Streptomyces sp. NBC_01497]|uniref:4a-hydroxytetrahydrobiopterin dehydratase n=1 Tax=Streptomyces sp. NBC_01497 TaxID=2903885 RepID=UPI002E344EFC|nr:4a-hydroxytetrahydrobiopterin dehydratase [Streptomyces sp. NBC_01497]
MAAEALAPDAVRDRLRDLPGWSLTDGGITRTYKLTSHFAATAMVVHIAQLQEELGHHSQLTLGYNTVSLTVNTHDAGGAVTGKDIELARRVEATAAGHAAE